jgi:hypothetical protein
MKKKKGTINKEFQKILEHSQIVLGSRGSFTYENKTPSPTNMKSNQNRVTIEIYFGFYISKEIVFFYSYKKINLCNDSLLVDSILGILLLH